VSTVLQHRVLQLVIASFVFRSLYKRQRSYNPPPAMLEVVGTEKNARLPETGVRAAFFSERVVNVWNSLPDSVDFSTLSKFRRSVMHVDFSKFLRCV